MRGMLIKAQYLMFLSILSVLQIYNNIILVDIGNQKISILKRCILHIYERLLSYLFLDNQSGKLFGCLQISLKA